MNNEAFGIADICQMRKQLETIDKFLACIPAAFDPEYDHAAKKLSFVGAMALSTSEALKAVAGVTQESNVRVSALTAANVREGLTRL